MTALKTIAEQRAMLDQLLAAAKALTADIEQRETAAVKKPGVFRVYRGGHEDDLRIVACNPSTGHYTGFWGIIGSIGMTRQAAEKACDNLNQWLAEYTEHRLSL